MGRNYSKKKMHFTRVADVIAANYNGLKARLCPACYGNYSGRSTEDIFCDTVIYVIQDENAGALATDAEVLDYFAYKYRMINFQVIQDSLQEKGDVKAMEKETDERF